MGKVIQGTLVILALATGGCFPFGDNEGPQGATKAQVEAALAICRVSQHFLLSKNDELTVKFPADASNVAASRRCIADFLQKQGVSVDMAWSDGKGT